MTPKDKAKELLDKYIPLTLRLVEEVDWVEDIDSAKQCALIAVDEILNTRPGSPYPQEIGLEVSGIYNQINYPTKYWQEVKHEIEKL